MVELKKDIVYSLTFKNTMMAPINVIYLGVDQARKNNPYIFAFYSAHGNLQVARLLDVDYGPRLRGFKEELPENYIWGTLTTPQPEDIPRESERELIKNKLDKLLESIGI